MPTRGLQLPKRYFVVVAAIIGNYLKECRRNKTYHREDVLGL
jgi:hypothetical protein